MEVLNVCPSCSNPTHNVTHKVINFFLKNYSIHKFNQNEQYYVCVNPDCTTAYYSRYIIIDVKEIKYPLWYKSKDRDVPICYCSRLTRGKIYDAVDNGCSKIDEIQ